MREFASPGQLDFDWTICTQCSLTRSSMRVYARAHAHLLLCWLERYRVLTVIKTEMKTIFVREAIGEETPNQRLKCVTGS